MPSPHSPRRPLALIVATMTLLTVMVSQPVAAADPGEPPFMTASGSFGVVALIDNPTFSGATCFYHPGTSPDLYSIKVRRPIVFAYDRNKRGIDRQTVGWGYDVEASNDLALWTPIYSSGISRATATDKTNADFRPRAHDVSPSASYYRVKVRVVWYRNGAVDGQAVLYPFYYGIDAGFTQFVNWYCKHPLV
jgi:hypothetical protein